MTDADIDAALTVANYVRNRGPNSRPRASVSRIETVALTEAVLSLVTEVRRLALEVRTLQAVLSDACYESSMYERGVRDALTALERMTCLYPLMADPLGVVGKSSALAAVRALLPP